MDSTSESAGMTRPNRYTTLSDENTANTQDIHMITAATVTLITTPNTRDSSVRSLPVKFCPMMVTPKCV